MTSVIASCLSFSQDLHFSTPVHQPITLPEVATLPGDYGGHYMSDGYQTLQANVDTDCASVTGATIGRGILCDV